MLRDDVSIGQVWDTPQGVVEVVDVLDHQVHLRWRSEGMPAFCRTDWLLAHGRLLP